MNITVVGTGYVGLVSGACFAEMGNQVTCVDVDKQKIEGLKQGVLPIYEPGLDAIVVRNQEEQRLTFTTQLADTVEDRMFFLLLSGPLPVRMVLLIFSMFWLWPEKLVN